MTPDNDSIHINPRSSFESAEDTVYALRKALSFKLHERLDGQQKHQQIINKQQSVTHDDELAIQLEDIREVMSLDIFDLDPGDMQEIWDRDTWREEPSITIDYDRMYSHPCLLFHDDGIKDKTIKKDRVLALYVLYPGKDSSSIRVDRVFLANQRRYKTQGTHRDSWGKVYMTDMPEKSLKTTLELLKDLGYKNITLAKGLERWNSNHAIDEKEFDTILHENDPIPVDWPLTT